jgi:hypothetical protein
MIDMEMRAHHEVNVVHRQAGGGQTLHPGIIFLLMPLRPLRPILVVADATINQYGVAAGLHDV